LIAYGVRPLVERVSEKVEILSGDEDTHKSVLKRIGYGGGKKTKRRTKGAGFDANGRPDVVRYGKGSQKTGCRKTSMCVPFLSTRSTPRGWGQKREELVGTVPHYRARDRKNRVE